jgi:hypothetical protein
MLAIASVAEHSCDAVRAEEFYVAESLSLRRFQNRATQQLGPGQPLDSQL